MTLHGRMLAFLVPASLLACAPSDNGSSETRELEIGVRTGDTFSRWQDGDDAVVLLGANGLNMIQPSLRAEGIDPRAPDPVITIEVGGLIMGADIEGKDVDMEPDDEGAHVLYDMRVPFDAELCCYVCAAGRVEATIRDAAGHDFSGSVTVNLVRGECPDPSACCPDESYCVNPKMATVCE